MATPPKLRKIVILASIGGATLALSACDKPLDFDLRGLAGGFNTAQAARQATAPRPAPDDRGVISYPNYQVAIARNGDTIADVAARVGLPAEDLARYNGIALQTRLHANEVIALPSRVAEPSPATGASTSGPLRPDSNIDIKTLAGNAIDRAGSSPAQQKAGPAAPSGKEPIRHKVEPGETAYSISRLYNVSVRSLAEWNGLGPDLSVHSGQYLLIPVTVESAAPKKADDTAAPGAGSATPVPPSASKPLPTEDNTATPAPEPTSPQMSNQRSSQAGGEFAMPVTGKIIRPYAKGTNDGIDIAAKAGSNVIAAQDGVVAAITRDTDQVPIIVLKHAKNMLTVYAGVDHLAVQKGDRVSRGQKIASVREGKPSFLHFEIRKGLESIDPVPFLN